MVNGAITRNKILPRINKAQKTPTIIDHVEPQIKEYAAKLNQFQRDLYRKGYDQQPWAKGNAMKTYTKYEIAEMFDSNPNLTMRELATITGLSVPELKKVLMDK